MKFKQSQKNAIPDTKIPTDQKHKTSAIREQCQQLFFRQSMIEDYSVCPRMCFYTWVRKAEEQDTWFTALLGTAGHEVVYHMHRMRRFELTYTELHSMFSDCFDRALADSPVPPKIGVNFSSIEDQFAALAPDYVTLLTEYMRDDINRNYHTVMHEQSYVLEVPDPIYPDDPPFLFTGQLDQFGYDAAGLGILADIKFRDASFRPTRFLTSLSKQLTLYSEALAHGVPVCNDCRPRYVDNFELVMDEMHFDGPCESCRAKIGTDQWPQVYPDKVKYTWMKDYERRKKDKAPKFIKCPQKTKELNPKTKRMRIREVINPKWEEGYKAGDFVGPIHIESQRTPERNKVLMADIIDIARAIRNAHFYRTPSPQNCGFWCKHRETCTAEANLGEDELCLTRTNDFSNDPDFNIYSIGDLPGENQELHTTLTPEEQALFEQGF